MKRIILTGGGTAGHVTPNIARYHVLKNYNTTSTISAHITELRKNLSLNSVYHIMASQPVNSDVISASRTSQIHSALSREWVKHVN